MAAGGRHLGQVRVVDKHASSSFAPRDLETIAKPYNGEDLAWHPTRAVTRAMNHATHQGDDCATPLKAATSPITAFFKPRVKGSCTKREADDAEEKPDVKKLKNSV